MFCGGFVAPWITRLTTDQKIPGSNPGKLILQSRVGDFINALIVKYHLTELILC